MNFERQELLDNLKRPLGVIKPAFPKLFKAPTLRIVCKRTVGLRILSSNFDNFLNQ